MQPSRFKKFLTLSSCVALSLSLAACAATKTPTPTTKTPPSSSKSSKSMMSKSSKPVRIRPTGATSSRQKISGVQPPKGTSSSVARKKTIVK